MKRPQIIICRHAESIEDVDNSIYDTLNDLDIPLTQKGEAQAQILGQTIATLINPARTLQFFTSPGLRNRQTLDLALPYIPNSIQYTIKVEPLLVKQNWGYITSENRPGIEEERYRTGVLRYKFPTGESAADLIRRLTLFKENIYALQDTECDIALLSHGFEFRVLLMLIMGWSEEFFESLGNLYNGEFRILTQKSKGIYELNEALRFHNQPITRLL